MVKGEITYDTLVQAIIALLYAGTIMATLYVSVKEIKNLNRQSFEQNRKNFFAEYTRRYQDIILAMPDGVFAGTAGVNSTTLKYMNLYFDLCSEEYHLYQEGLLPDEVWYNWVEGMRVTTNLALYRQCWERLKGQYNEMFWKFFEREVIKS